MMNKVVSSFLVLFCTAIFLGTVHAEDVRTITDSEGRKLTLPENVEHIICSGPGALRLITYFNAQHLVVAVDDIETRKKMFDARPYVLANPQFKKMPVFGGFRGNDDPEKILGLPVLPQVIFKTYPTMGYNPEELQKKTGIPVIVLNYGDLSDHRKAFFTSLEIVGKVLHRENRAKELIAFFKSHINDLNLRTADVSNKKTCFVGGIAFKGPHGYQSTEPSYPPFSFVNANNIASSSRKSGAQITHTNFSKERLLDINPDVLFLDLSTIQMGKGHGGLHELKNDPVYQAMDAVQSGNVYGVLPYNWYSRNFGSILADAWYVGKILYPDRFSDIDPAKKADDIYEYLLGARVFSEMNHLFKDMAFQPVPLKEK